MKASNRFAFLLVLLFWSSYSLQAKTKGQEVIATLKTELIFASNGDIAVAGENAQALSAKQLAKLKKNEALSFKDYRLMGGDEQSVFRSYENWAMPMRPSEEILLSFESKGVASKNCLILDLELWVSRKKVMKYDAKLTCGKKLYVLGPEWRGGRLIIAVQVNQGSHKN